VNCAQIRSIDKLRLQGERIAHLDAQAMRAIDAALRASLGL
jgi:mRNA-degrading endonuclease toxin of MazEF toxin-antitoxin module